jgi:hypothetical protein
VVEAVEVVEAGEQELVPAPVQLSVVDSIEEKDDSYTL